MELVIRGSQIPTCQSSRHLDKEIKEMNPDTFKRVLDFLVYNKVQNIEIGYKDVFKNPNIKDYLNQIERYKRIFPIDLKIMTSLKDIKENLSLVPEGTAILAAVEDETEEELIKSIQEIRDYNIAALNTDADRLQITLNLLLDGKRDLTNLINAMLKENIANIALTSVCPEKYDTYEELEASLKSQMKQLNPILEILLKELKPINMTNVIMTPCMLSGIEERIFTILAPNNFYSLHKFMSTLKITPEGNLSFCPKLGNTVKKIYEYKNVEEFDKKFIEFFSSEMPYKKCQNCIMYQRNECFTGCLCMNRSKEHFAEVVN